MKGRRKKEEGKRIEEEGKRMEEEGKRTMEKGKRMKDEGRSVESRFARRRLTFSFLLLTSSLLLTFSFLLLPSSLATPLPLPWRADWPNCKPIEKLVHRGSDVALQPTFYINSLAADTNGWAFSTFVQTNAVGAWFGPLPGAFFSHTNDVGAAFYNVMVRAETPGGSVNYTAFARFRMLDSPGFTPGELPLPAKVIDFADVTVLNPPWGEGPGNYAAVSNAAMNALSRAEAEAGFTVWTILRNGVDVTSQVAQPIWVSAASGWRVYDSVVPGDTSLVITRAETTEDSVSFDWGASTDGGPGIAEYLATRTRLPTMADIAAEIAVATNNIPRITESSIGPGVALTAENAIYATSATDADSARYAQEASFAYNAEYANQAGNATVADALRGNVNSRTGDVIFSQLDAATATNAAQTAALAAQSSQLSQLSQSIANLAQRTSVLETQYVAITNLLDGLEAALRTINGGN